MELNKVILDCFIFDIYYSPKDNLQNETIFHLHIIDSFYLSYGSGFYAADPQLCSHYRIVEFLS